MIIRSILCAVLLVLAALGCRKNETSSAAKGPAGAQSNAIVADAAPNLLPNVPGFENSGDRFASHLAPVLNRVATGDDVWDTEVFSEQAKQQLKKLAKMMSTKQAVAGEGNGLFTEPFVTRPLRPSNLAVVFDDGSTTVSRSNGSEQVVTTENYQRDFPRAAEMLIRENGPLNAHFKLFRVASVGDVVETSVLFDASQPTKSGAIQQNAVWDIRWTNGSSPRIASIEVRDFEEISTKTESRWRDATYAVLGNCESYRNQLTKGVDHWRKRLEANYGVDPNGNQGIALGDVNGDGLEDVFVCQQGGLPNRLYVQRANGVLEDFSREAGVDWMEMCRSALFVDFDNDGDQDLAMAQGWYMMICANDGTGRFQVVRQERCQANLHSISAADYDQDGDVDIFFCGRNPVRELGQSEGLLGTPIPYHDANNGGPNILLRNDGAMKFTDVTKQVGLDANNRRYSYAASWEDYDNDGDMDLYVANDFGRNNLYRNDAGKFRDVAAELGVEDISAGMSVTWGDYNNDGMMDAYVSNMFSSAGNRIAYQRKFRDDTNADQRKQFQRHARGNTLFEGKKEGAKSQNDNQFRDVSEVANVTMGRWAWGSKFCDFNNDGWEDLYVANGFITTDDTGDL